jgi:hypothetical protein
VWMFFLLSLRGKAAHVVVTVQGVPHNCDLSAGLGVLICNRAPGFFVFFAIPHIYEKRCNETGPQHMEWPVWRLRSRSGGCILSELHPKMEIKFNLVISMYAH